MADLFTSPQVRNHEVTLATLLRWLECPALPVDFHRSDPRITAHRLAVHETLEAVAIREPGQSVPSAIARATDAPSASVGSMPGPSPDLDAVAADALLLVRDLPALAVARPRRRPERIHVPGTNVVACVPVPAVVTNSDGTLSFIDRGWRRASAGRLAEAREGFLALAAHQHYRQPITGSLWCDLAARTQATVVVSIAPGRVASLHRLAARVAADTLHLPISTGPCFACPDRGGCAGRHLLNVTHPGGGATASAEDR